MTVTATRLDNVGAASLQITAQDTQGRAIAAGVDRLPTGAQRRHRIDHRTV